MVDAMLDVTSASRLSRQIITTTVEARLISTHVMKSAASHPLLALTTLHLALLCSVAAFSPSRLKCPRSSTTKPWHRRTISSSTTLTFGAADECNDERDSDEIYRRDSNRSVPNDIGLDIIRGSNSEISDETWGDIEGGAPSGWMVMKGVSVLQYH
jgi:hypothetical protein